MKTIRDTTSRELRATLRQTHTVSSAVKAAVYSGNASGDPQLTVQFNSDVKLYGLWEALLYVEGYERDGYYKPGTAAAAVLAGASPEDEWNEDDGFTKCA